MNKLLKTSLCMILIGFILSVIGFLAGGRFHEISITTNGVRVYDTNKDKNIVKEICLFLYKFKFATKKQIINVISKKYNISIDFNFQELVDFDFFKDFILVKGFVDEEYERNEENTIYAIGPNGVNLLIEYFNIEVPRWEFRNISRSAEKVIKSLQVVDIYINMMESFKDFNIINESVGPNQRRALGDKLDIDFEWSIASNIIS